MNSEYSPAPYFRYSPRMLHEALDLALTDPLLSSEEKHELCCLIASTVARSQLGLNRITDVVTPESVGVVEWSRLLRASWRACRTGPQRIRFMEWMVPQMNRGHRVAFEPVCDEILRTSPLLLPRAA